MRVRVRPTSMRSLAMSASLCADSADPARPTISGISIDAPTCALLRWNLVK